MTESQQAYGFPQPTQAIFPAPFITDRDPTAADNRKKGFVIGQNWINVTNNTVFVLTSDPASVAVWSISTAGSSNVDTLTGDTGGAITPLAGNISLLGTTNEIDSTGTANTITFSIPSAFVAPGSIASTTTIASGTTLTAGTSLAVTTSATIGTTLAVSGTTTLAAVNATNGTFSGTLGVTGTSTLNAITATGTINLNASGAGVTTIGTGGTGATNIGNATGNTAVTGGLTTTTSIGAGTTLTSAGATTLATTGASVNTFGNATGATSVTITSGTGGIALASTGAGDITLASSDTLLLDSAGVLELNSSAGAISIGNDAVAQAINIGTGAAARTISIGTGAAVVETIAIGGTGANVITIGNTQTAGSIAMGTAMTTGTVSIGGTGLHVGTFDLAPGTGAQTVSLANGSGIKTLQIGNGVSGNTITIGNGVNSVAQTVSISGGAAAANSTVNILSGNASSGTQTLNLATGTGGKTVHIADAAGVNAVTIGSTSSTSATTINAGSGNLTLVGNVLKTTNPAFLAYLAVTAGNKTGSGTSYTLGTDALTEVFDRGSNFNTNGTFTAPVTGLYDLHAQVTITGATIATTFIISIVATSRTAIYTFIKAAGSQDESVQISSLFDMTATDTAHVTIAVNGEAGDTADILGAASLQTFFCGSLIA
jgi:hypothetical protein